MFISCPYGQTAEAERADVFGVSTGLALPDGRECVWYVAFSVQIFVISDGIGILASGSDYAAEDRVGEG
jgi:hypothetical protein